MHLKNIQSECSVLFCILHHHWYNIDMPLQITIDVERFTELNVHDFNPIEVSQKYFCNALARSA